MALVDDRAAVLARRVAMAAAAWLRAPTDTTAYGRLVEASEAWEAYCAPTITDGQEPDETDDLLADIAPPRPLGELIPELEGALHRQARKEL